MRYALLLVPFCAMVALAKPIAQPEERDSATANGIILPSDELPSIFEALPLEFKASSPDDALHANDAGSAPIEQRDEPPEEDGPAEDAQKPQVQLKKVKIKPGKKKIKWVSGDRTDCKAKCKAGKPCKFSDGPVCKKDWPSMGFADEENESQGQE